MNWKPLAVDLDGTLLRSDVLVETGFAYLKTRPLAFYRPLLWLLKDGKAALKQRLAEAAPLDVSVLPYDPAGVDWLRHEKAAGRKLVLATAADGRHARAIADHLGLFDDVLATDGAVNLSAASKRDALIAAYGEKGFDYAGNSNDDLPVWAAAERAIVVNPGAGVAGRARQLGNVERVIETHGSAWRAWAKALRLHQWVKNLLIFLPLLAAHQVGTAPLDVAALLAFLSFGCCASSVYLLNDLLDLEDDRHHATKRRRPFASGALPLPAGAAVCPLLLFAAAYAAWRWLPPGFALVLAGYYVLTLAYSFVLKRRVMVDVVTLAALYTTRIIAGAEAIHGRPTFWLLAFSMFLFLSLALVKRHAELLPLLRQGRHGAAKARGRGYLAEDLPIIASLGTASGYLSVLVLALYVQDAGTANLYRHPQLIWLACPLMLFWIGRIWLIAHRGLMHDDPVVFAAKDRTSLLIAALIGLICWLAT